MKISLPKCTIQSYKKEYFHSTDTEEHLDYVIELKITNLRESESKRIQEMLSNYMHTLLIGFGRV